MGLEDEIDAIVSAEDVRRGKPDPAVFLDRCHTGRRSA